ncbi:MAG: hypothetical protein JXB04_09785 [Kiritimatiellae bacterium]|nr:hypothetical protein [Kiritimatiellia bacterium]
MTETVPKERRMTTTGLVLVLIAAGMTVAANLLMRTGIVKAGGFPAELVLMPRALLRLLRQPTFVTGGFLYVSASLVWFRVIATEPLSTAYPLLVSLAFIFVTLGAVILFGESCGARKTIGLVVILVGIFLVSRG